MTLIDTVGEFLIQWVWLIILTAFILEVCYVFTLFREYHLEVVTPEETVSDLAISLRGHALTLSGLTFTVIAILVALTDDPTQYADLLAVLAVAVALLLLSFEIKELTRRKRVWFMMQEKSLAYGYMSLFLGVVLLYYLSVPGVSWIVIFVVFIVASAIRYMTVRDQVQMLIDMRDNTESVKESGGSEQKENTQS